jgi:Viral BACON domain/FG-GAP-like repeat
MSHLLRRVAIIALLVLGYTVPALARTVTIVWDANTEKDLAGYVVYLGTMSRDYSASVDVGNRTDYVLDVDDFTTYYIAIEAYNAAGDRSPLSSEVVVAANSSACELTLNNPNVAVGALPSNVSVSLTATPECRWNATSYSSWIAVGGRTSSGAAGTVSLAVAANLTPQARVGTVWIGNQLLLITQAGVTCAVSAKAADFGTFVKEGGAASISVSANAAGCGWSVTSDAFWLKFSGASSRQGAGSVAFTVAANSGAARTGHLTVAGKVFTIAQRARKRVQALDFDGRGADAFLYNLKSGFWTQYSWTGAFTARQSGVTTPGMTVLPADFNGDDRSDLFAYDKRTGVWGRSISAKDGSTSFTESVWQAGWVPTIVDLNGDGRSDVFFYNPRSGAWVQWITQPTTLAFTQRSGKFAAGWTVYRARFDGDARDDLFLYNANPKTSDRNAGKWAQVFTQGNYSFVVKPGRTPWTAGSTVLPVDFNGDGLSEVFILTKTGKWSVASFSAKGVTLTRGAWAASWQVFRAEFNGDNASDLFLFNSKTGQYRLAIRKGSSFTILRGAWSKGLVADVTDLNGDGRSDVVVYNPSVGTVGAARSTTKPGAFVYTGGSFGKGLTLLAGHPTLP